jgi:hypothetical protein
MFANLQRTLSLYLREKTGLTASFLILVCIAVVAALAAFIFLCVSGYAWAAAELGPVFGGLHSRRFSRDRRMLLGCLRAQPETGAAARDP